MDQQEQNAGMTAFMAAAVSGHHRVVLLLAAYGANPTLVDQLGRNVVWHAAHKGHAQVLKILVTRFQNWTAFQSTVLDVMHNEPGKPRFTPLMKAVEMGHQSAVATLLLAKASPDTVDPSDKDGRTALELAAASGNKEMVETLCDLGTFKPSSVGRVFAVATQTAKDLHFTEVVEALADPKLS